MLWCCRTVRADCPALLLDLTIDRNSFAPWCKDYFAVDVVVQSPVFYYWRLRPAKQWHRIGSVTGQRWMAVQVRYICLFGRGLKMCFFFWFFFKSGRYVKMADLFVRHLGYIKRVRRWLPYSQRFRREAITNSSIMQHLLCFWRRNLQQISYRYVFFYVCFLFNSFLGNVSTVSTKYLQGVITL